MEIDRWFIKALTTRISFHLKTQLFISVFKKIRVHTVSYSYRFRLELIVWHQRFRKVSFLPVHTKTVKQRFQKVPLWRAFSKSCVFGYRFHRIRVDDSRIRNKKVAFSNENGYVWSGPETVMWRPTGWIEYLSTIIGKTCIIRSY